MDCPFFEIRFDRPGFPAPLAHTQGETGVEKEAANSCRLHFLGGYHGRARPMAYLETIHLSSNWSDKLLAGLLGEG